MHYVCVCVVEKTFFKCIYIYISKLEEGYLQSIYKHGVIFVILPLRKILEFHWLQSILHNTVACLLLISRVNVSLPRGLQIKYAYYDVTRIHVPIPFHWSQDILWRHSYMKTNEFIVEFTVVEKLCFIMLLMV